MINAATKYEKKNYYNIIEMGRAVIFNPNDDFTRYSKERIIELIDKIQIELSNCHESMYKIAEYRDYLNVSNYTYDAFYAIYMDPYFKDLMIKEYYKNKRSLIEVFKDVSKIREYRVKNSALSGCTPPKSMERAEKWSKKFQPTFINLISRVLLQDVLSCEKDDVIVVTTDFKKEYFYQIPKNVKGFIFRNVEERTEAVEFAYAYEIPFVETSIDILENQIIIIDNIKNQVILDPEANLREQYSLEISKQRFKSRMPKYNMNLIEYYAPIVDDRYLDLLQEYSSWYHGMSMLRTEYLYMSKGYLPTVEEMVDLFVKTIKALDGRDVYIRVPDLGEYKSVEYAPTVETAVVSSERIHLIFYRFYEALEKAILITQKKIHLVAPMVRMSIEIEKWKFAALDVGLDNLPKELKPYFGIMMETESSLEECEEYVKVDFIILGLNDIIEEYTDEFTRYDSITIDEMRETIFEDVRYAHQHFRRTGIRLSHMISGNMLDNLDIFQKLINSGFTKYIVPIKKVGMFEEVLYNHEETRGKFRGIAAERKARGKTRVRRSSLKYK